MPPLIHHRIDHAFGPNCVFAITQWDGFLAALDDNQATVTGTLEEVATPYGTGLRVAAANSYARFDLTPKIPLTVTPRTIIARVYFPNNTTDYAIAAWGANVANDGFFLANASGVVRGGFVGDYDSAGAVTAAWLTFSVSNAGVNAGANVAYLQGTQTVAGTNGAAGVTAASDLFLFRTPFATMQCPIGTIIQSVLVFDDVRSPADLLHLHNMAIGAAP